MSIKSRVMRLERRSPSAIPVVVLGNSLERDGNDVVAGVVRWARGSAQQSAQLVRELDEPVPEFKRRLFAIAIEQAVIAAGSPAFPISEDEAKL